MLGVEWLSREFDELASSSRFERGLRGVIFAVSDDHPGSTAISVVRLIGSAVSAFLRNALDTSPQGRRRLPAMRWLTIAHAEKPQTWRPGSSLAEKYPKLCAWSKKHREPHLLPLPRSTTNTQSTNMLERINQELKRRPTSCDLSQEPAPAADPCLASNPRD